MARSLTVLLLVLLAASSVACGEAEGTRISGHGTSGVSFEPPAGWFSVTTDGFAPPDGNPLPVAWAANVPFADDPAEAWPDATIRRLPAEGIVLVAVGPTLYTGEEEVPTLSLPLRLSDLYCVSDGYEGQPAPNVSFCYIAGRIGTTNIFFNADVWFGRNEPTPEMKAEAEDVLATLSVSG